MRSTTIIKEKTTITRRSGRVSTSTFASSTPAPDASGLTFISLTSPIPADGGSPKWISGSDVVFKTPKASPPISRRRTTMVNFPPVQGAGIKSPPGVKTRSRRASVYTAGTQKDGGRVLKKSTSKATLTAAKVELSGALSDAGDANGMLPPTMKPKRGRPKGVKTAPRKKQDDILSHVVVIHTPANRRVSLPITKPEEALKTPEKKAAKVAETKLVKTPEKKVVKTPEEPKGPVSAKKVRKSLSSESKSASIKSKASTSRKSSSPVKRHPAKVSADEDPVQSTPVAKHQASTKRPRKSEKLESPPKKPRKSTGTPGKSTSSTPSVIGSRKSTSVVVEILEGTPSAKMSRKSIGNVGKSVETTPLVKRSRKSISIVEQPVQGTKSAKMSRKSVSNAEKSLQSTPKSIVEASRSSSVSVRKSRRSLISGEQSLRQEAVESFPESPFQESLKKKHMDSEVHEVTLVETSSQEIEEFSQDFTDSKDQLNVTNLSANETSENLNATLSYTGFSQRCTIL